MRLHNQMSSSLYIKDCRFLSAQGAFVQSEENMFAVVDRNGRRDIAIGGVFCGKEDDGAIPVCGVLPLPSARNLGDETFMRDYGTRYAYYGGAMAGGISSVDMVVALGKAGFMGSYGAGGVELDEIERAIDVIQGVLPNGPYMVNFLHNLSDPAREFQFVRMLVGKNVPVIEASAFIELPLALLYYKISGLVRRPDGTIHASRKIIAKVSREEVAQRFMSPANKGLVAQLLKINLITEEQAVMSQQVPVADDVTVEADSGGHTDNRPLVSLLPAMLKLRDRMQEKYKYANKIRIGAAGGISTPEAALGAFQMGAAYVVTGSVNQACVEAGTSDYVKNTLAEVTMADVVMAPCADMFEFGTKVQVIKRGTMYPMNAQKLHDLYSKNKSITELSEKDMNRLTKVMFKASVDEIWEEVCTFFNERDPRQIKLAQKNSKLKMALLFRWYLGHSSRWAIEGTEDRRMDMQIWCGQSMGAFNNWAKGTYLESPDKRFVADIAGHIMDGAAYLQMKNLAVLAGIDEREIPAYGCRQKELEPSDEKVLVHA